MNSINVIYFFDVAFGVYRTMLFVRIVLSWFPMPRSPVLVTIWNFIYDMTEPVLGLFRRLLPPAMMGSVGIDFSPIIAFFVLQFVYGSLFRPLLATILGF